MAFAPSKLTEMPLRTPFPLTSHSHYSSSSLNTLLFFCSTSKPSFHLLNSFSSLRAQQHFDNGNRSPKTNRNRSSDHQNPKPSPTWLHKWPSSSVSTKEKPTHSNGVELETVSKTQFLDKDKGQSAIDRIVLRLRNLGLGSDEEEGVEEKGDDNDISDSILPTGEERLGDLLRREWVRPDTIFAQRERNDEDETVLPWDRDAEEHDKSGEVVGLNQRRVIKAPSLAELTIEDAELRRLRRTGMYLRERISVPKAGITQAVLDKIHDQWRKEELVRLKFHEVLARDMKTAHEIVERRTRGLVTWRSGSVMVVYRGANYDGPASKSKPADRGEDLFVPDVSSAGSAVLRSENMKASTLEKTVSTVNNPDPNESMTEEESEFNSLLDDLGPRFHEWWGTGVLPVDADLLPPKIPDYKTPFRLLPARMRPRLTNAEMTNLRKVAKSLPSHFALGRNRNHQGLAAAILQLWEKSLVAKIAVKRGIQNTNNKIMADELKNLTGGVLLLRNKYYIVIYRGKDFVPTSVAVVLAERQELTKEIQDVEEQARSGVVEAVQSGKENPQAHAAGTLAEFYEAQARWGREISADERQKMIEEASIAKHARDIRRIEHKLSIAQAKKHRADKLLAKIEASMVPSGPDYDQETITAEEQIVFRRIGLRMKAYLPLGIRGVFDGVIENMHLHWKHREFVKLITKQKTLAFVEDTSRLLEFESGGILVAIERVPKGYALIYYRGKNYQRPVTLRPRNLLTKAKALKRSVAMQRHEALSQHISEVERTIEQMKNMLSKDETSLAEPDSGSEDEEEEEDDKYWEAGDDSELSSSEDEEIS